MSRPAPVESIFFAALEKKAAERADYLDHACGDDAALRHRVERLLDAHPRAEDFLAQPAVDRPEFEPHDADEDLTGLAPTNISGAIPRDPTAGIGMIEPTSPETLQGTAAIAPETLLGTELFTGEAGPDAFSTTVGAPPANRRIGFVPGQVIGGRYTLLEVIGEGGMGTVYRADQTEPVKRQVALKLIKPGMDSRSLLARFEAERQALALMDHPNIARVYDGGTTATGRPFFVMDLVIGTPITDYCDSHRLPVRRRLELFVAVCQAVQHAHQKGIIHRDLKPGNVLVTEVDGRPTPKVIDFGVATATDFHLGDQSLGDTGAIVGTPAYMSPEQADPSTVDIDTRTDIYALGVILYELLAGSPPIDATQFQRGAIFEMLRMVREVDPPRPSTKVSTSDALPNIAAHRDIEPEHLKRALKGDLDWIVMKALEKDRARRYATANGFATDVLRHLACEPVLAAPPSRAYRLRKLVRKHRGAVIAASLVVLALLAGIAGTTWGLIEARRQERIAREEASETEKARQAEAERAEGERRATRKALAAAEAEKKAKETAQSSFAEARKAEREATEQRNRADHEAEVAQQNLYDAQMHLAQQAWREHRGLTHMRELLANWTPRGESPDRRGWEWFYLNSLPYQNLRTLTRSGSGGNCTVAWHVASKRLAEGTPEGLIRIWDVDRERTTLILRAPAPVVPWSGVRWLGWSPDGGQLAAGCNDGTVHLWETGSGRELKVLQGHRSPVWSVAFSSDGTRVAAWGQDGTIKIWDARTGRPTADVAHPGGVTAGTWSPDDKLLATGHGDGTATISGTHDGDKIVTLRGHADLIYDLAWSPDGTRLASSSGDFTAKIWEVASQEVVLGPLRHSHGITSLAWEPDGQRLATGSIDETVKIWDATTGREALTLRGHVQRVTSLSWGPDGRLASGCGDGSMKIWNSIRNQEAIVLPGHVVRATSVSWSPDGTRLASGGDDGKVRIWDPATRKEVLTLKGHDERRVIPQFGLIRSLNWSPDGTQLASASLDGTAKVWEVASGREVFALPTDHGRVWSVAWSPDGTRLAAGSEDGTIRVVEGLKRTPLVRVFQAHKSRVRALAWSHRGDRLASGAWVDPVVKVWDPIRGADLARMQGHRSSVLGVAWSPDGTRLASASTDYVLITWDAQSGRKLATMRGHNDFVDAVAWSPDGTRLASAGIDNSVRVWDPQTGKETFVLRGDSGMFHDVSWHPDGARLAAASSDGQIWIWDATRGFERDTTARALPYIDRRVASGTARGEDLLWNAESYLRAGKPGEALVALKDDPSGLCMFARHLDEQGHAPLADEARTKARALLEQQLAAEPGNETPAFELADLLLMESDDKWTVLKPTEMKSEGGATLTLREDGSILAGGKNPDRDDYTLVSRPGLEHVTAIRLEALTDLSLPGNGPGRFPDPIGRGNFHLNELRVSSGGKPSTLTNMIVAYDELQEFRNVIDGRIDATRGWSNYPRVGMKNTAILATRLHRATDEDLKIELYFSRANWTRHNLGCFRLSVSADADAFNRERFRIAAKKVGTPWAKLAAAYHVIDNRGAFEKLLQHHPAAAAAIGDLYVADQDWERAIAEYRRVLSDQPADGNLVAKLATAYQAAGRTREAVPHLATLSSASPKDTILSLKVAALQAWFGQDKELAASRQRIIAFATGTNDNEAATAERAAKACSILPSTDKAELEAALVLARAGVKLARTEWTLLALGMAEYRSGNDSAAEETLLAAAKAGPNNPFVTGTSAFYRAMSLFRQGKPDEARKLATAAAAKMKPRPADEENPLAGDANHDDLILWLAYKETDGLR